MKGNGIKFGMGIISPKFAIKMSVILFCVLTIGACKKNEVSLPTLHITPSELKITLEPGEIANFSINVEAEGGLNRFEIIESVDGAPSTSLLDSTLGGENLSDISFSYQMPITKKATEIRLVFKVYDAQNNFGSAARSLLISGADSLLTEITGLSLYSLKSGNQNGYLIATDTLVYSDSVFFEDLDLVCTDTTDTLSYTLVSPISNEFVVFNSFNYDSATYRTMTEAFDFGTPTTSLSSLQSGDIIITKLSTPTLYDYALIKITGINDDAGSANDRYVFSIKK